MSKKSRKRDLSDNEAKAVTRLIRISPNKLNLVATRIRGKKVETALADLAFSRKRIAQDVKKTLETAIANAVVENTNQFHGLYVPPFLKKGTFVFFAIDNKTLPRTL